MGRTLNSSPVVRRAGRNGDEYVQVPLRMPPAMQAKLRDAAVAEGRSLNAEICLRLGKTLGEEFALLADDGPSLLQQIADDLRAVRTRMEARYEINP